MMPSDAPAWVDAIYELRCRGCNAKAEARQRRDPDVLGYLDTCPICSGVLVGKRKAAGDE